MLHCPVPETRSFLPQEGIFSRTRTDAPAVAPHSAQKSPEGPPPATTMSYCFNSPSLLHQVTARLASLEMAAVSVYFATAGPDTYQFARRIVIVMLPDYSPHKSILQRFLRQRV